ncbi:MAG: LPS export ABC transporter permease LptF, partial [Acidobacteriota bacterium]
MFKPLDRYIFKEILPPFFLGILLFTFILLMNQVLLLSEMFIAKGVPFRTAIQLLVNLIPSVLAFAVPMSVLVGILSGLSRMSSDSEIVAFKILGISDIRILQPLLVFSLVGWLLTSFLALYLAPRANYRWVQALTNSVLTNVQIQIEPRQFYENIPRTVLYIQDIPEEGYWENVFVYSLQTPEEPRIILANKGSLYVHPEEKRIVLDLYQGRIHSYPSAEPDKYRVTEFSNFKESLDTEAFFQDIKTEKRVREKTIFELQGDSDQLRLELENISQDEISPELLALKKRNLLSHRVEIHKKFALPFACIVFALLGLPLGATTRKGGRTSGFTLSLGIILIYYILITAGEKFSIDGRIAPWLGMWGANIIIGLGGIWLLLQTMRESPLFNFWIKKRKLKSSPTPVPIKRMNRKGPLFRTRFPGILDRYIIRRYVFVFSLIFAAFISVFVIVTFFERIDRVYEHQKPISLFLNYLWYRLPEFIHYTLPVAALTASLLTLGLMTKFNEVMAAKACGISIYRLILPVVIMGVLVGFLSFYLQENILPAANKNQEKIWNDINNIPPRTYTHPDQRWIMGKDRNRIYYFRVFDPISSTFGQLSVFDIDLENWTLSRRIWTEKAYLKENLLVLINAWMREFDEGLPVSYKETERAEIIPVEEKSYFIKEHKDPEQMSYQELNTYMSEIERLGFATTRLKVDLHYKLSFPFACLIMTLLAIPFAFTMGKKGALVGLGLSVVMAMVFWGAIGVFKSFGYVAQLPPLLAAWGPNLLFGLSALY